VEEKIEAIRNLAFPTTLRQLGHTTGFFGYYRKFVEQFAAIVEPLVKLKTKGLKEAPRGGQERNRYTEGKVLTEYSSANEQALTRLILRLAVSTSPRPQSRCANQNHPLPGCPCRHLATEGGFVILLVLFVVFAWVRDWNIVDLISFFICTFCVA